MADWLEGEGRAKLAPNRGIGIDFLEAQMNYEERDKLEKRKMDGRSFREFAEKNWK